MNKYIKYSILFLIILFISFLFNIFYLSYRSYDLSCNTPELISNETINGFLDVESGNITICLSEDSVGYDRILKHELIHLRQKNQGRLYGCDEPIKFYFSEVEAYFLENF